MLSNIKSWFDCNLCISQFGTNFSNVVLCTFRVTRLCAYGEIENGKYELLTIWLFCQSLCLPVISQNVYMNQSAGHFYYHSWFLNGIISNTCCTIKNIQREITDKLALFAGFFTWCIHFIMVIVACVLSVYEVMNYVCVHVSLNMHISVFVCVCVCV